MTMRKAELKSGLRQTILRVPFLSLALLFLMLFFLRNSELAKNAVAEGLRRAALVVLPSVFPFLVLSDLLATGGGVPRAMSGWLSPILRVSKPACSAILLGWICGFPIGAVYGAKELESGNISREEFERTVAAASIPSPAFLIGVVGAGTFNSAKAGVFLWIFCLLSAAIICVFSGKKQKIYRKIPRNSPLPAPVPFFKGLTGAIKNAAGVSLRLCAFIAFFSVLISAVQSVFARFMPVPLLSSGVAALLELTGGIASSSAISEVLRYPFCAAACGFAGFSVHFQIFAVCEKTNFQYGKYLLAKGLQTLFCFLFALVFQLLQKS